MGILIDYLCYLSVDTCSLCSQSSLTRCFRSDLSSLESDISWAWGSMLSMGFCNSRLSRTNLSIKLTWTHSWFLHTICSVLWIPSRLSKSRRGRLLSVLNVVWASDPPEVLDKFWVTFHSPRYCTFNSKLTDSKHLRIFQIWLRWCSGSKVAWRRSLARLPSFSLSHLQLSLQFPRLHPQLIYSPPNLFPCAAFLLSV